MAAKAAAADQKTKCDATRQVCTRRRDTVLATRMPNIAAAFRRARLAGHSAAADVEQGTEHSTEGRAGPKRGGAVNPVVPLAAAGRLAAAEQVAAPGLAYLRRDCREYILREEWALARSDVPNPSGRRARDRGSC